MPLDSSLVRVATTGRIYAGLTGDPALPTDATTAPGAGFTDLGYAGEDGVTQTISADTTQIRAWQNGDTVRTVQTTHDVTYQFTFLETNPAVLEAYYGNYNAGTVEIRSDVLPRMPWVVDVVDGDELVRIAVPSAQITERGDITFTNGDAIAYPVTLTAYPVAEVKAYLYVATIED